MTLKGNSLVDGVVVFGMMLLIVVLLVEGSLARSVTDNGHGKYKQYIKSKHLCMLIVIFVHF